MPEIHTAPETRTAPSPPRVWTPGRKLLGNVIPFLAAAPVLAAGLWRTLVENATYGEAAVWLAAFVAALWMAANFLGLYKNASMKRALRRRLEASIPAKELPADPYFAGFARPAYRSLVDPHEDVGFLLLHDDRVEFFGDADRYVLPKSCLTRVVLRPNPHSWAFLGGWVSVEGVLEGKPVRMLLEPREKNVLFANRSLREVLRKRIQDWLDPKEAKS